MRASKPKYVIKCIKGDLSRIKHESGKKALWLFLIDHAFLIWFNYRSSQFLDSIGLRIISKILWEKPVQNLLGFYLPSNVKIGPGLRIFHGQGIIINSAFEAGANLTLYARACIGSSKPGGACPVAKDDVVIATGACAFGNLILENNTVVTANSVIHPGNYTNKLPLKIQNKEATMIAPKDPLVTIAVATYNTEKYLHKCLDSITNQTYKKLQIIIVNDGSIDNSGKIADEYSAKDQRIEVIHQKNQGLGGCRNTAIRNAKGEFISFIDSDDFIEHDFVDYMLKLEQKTSADIVMSSNCFTTLNMNQVKFDRIESISNKRAIQEFFYPNIKLGAWNKMYRMRLIRDNNLVFFPELSTGEGLHFITRAASHTNKVGIGKRKVYIYRLNNTNSATTKANVEKQGIGALKTINLIGKSLPMDDPDTRRAYNWHLWSCHR